MEVMIVVVVVVVVVSRGSWGEVEVGNIVVVRIFYPVLLPKIPPYQAVHRDTANTANSCLRHQIPGFVSPPRRLRWLSPLQSASQGKEKREGRYLFSHCSALLATFYCACRYYCHHRHG